MRIKIFGRIFYIPTWLKITLIAIILVVLIVIGYSVRKEKNILEDNPDLLSVQTTPPDIEETVLTTVSDTPAPESATPSATKYISVYIVGCVKNPSVIMLPPGSIVQHAVDAAGGLTKDADPTKINMAYPLSDNMMIKVPSKSDTDIDASYTSGDWLITSPPKNTAATENLPQGQPTGKININTADIKTLCNLPGIGESTAQKIIDFRNQNGPFEYIEDIMKIPGIKQSRFDSIKDMITV